MSNISRRGFVKGTVAMGAAATVGFPNLLHGTNLNEKLQVGFVAVGGRARRTHESRSSGRLPMRGLRRSGQDPLGRRSRQRRLERGERLHGLAKVFENHANELDVIFVATPDHNHFAPSMTAVSLGIHCYTEKPLTWSVREALLLQQSVSRRTRTSSLRWATRGMPAMVGAWPMNMSKPVPWAKSRSSIVGRTVRVGRKAATAPIGPIPFPIHLDWDAWIGSAPMRPYAGPHEEHSREAADPITHSIGAAWSILVVARLGDMACHITDGVYAIMEPSYAATAEPLVMTGPVGEQWPGGMVVKCTYRAKGDWPEFATYWYEGKDKDGTALPAGSSRRTQGRRTESCRRTAI